LLEKNRNSSIIFKKRLIFTVYSVCTPLAAMDYRAAEQYILQRLRSELSESLYYHGLHHTLDVLRVAIDLCLREGVEGKDLALVKTAALFHDAGFVHNKHIGHEQAGCEMAQAALPAFGYTEADIAVICDMIMATKIPQSPKNLLEEIICDADLDYLGRPDFYPIGRSLYRELAAYELIGDEQAWNHLQVRFLSAHQYHTQTNRGEREPVKQRYLEELRDLVANY
jgi:HD superfamily phosphodiesterase